MTVHHIGYLVKKLERARSAFEALGYGVERETVRDEFRKVDIVFLVKDGYRVELVSPYDPSSSSRRTIPPPSWPVCSRARATRRTTSATRWTTWTRKSSACATPGT